MKTATTGLVQASHPEQENYRNDPLWQRLKDFTPDEPDASFPFTKKLAQENGWDRDFTLAAVEEYKRFAYLCCALPQGASPPPVVDKVWHLHLCYTLNYWDVFCEQILQRELHHHPSKGGEAEIRKHDHWMRETLYYYRKIFGTDPPSEIWMQSDADLNQVIRKSAKTGRWLKWLAALALLLLVVVVVNCDLPPVAAPIMFFIAVFLIGCIAGKKPGNGSYSSDSSGGCGNSCSGGDSSDGGSGCGGCGGD